MGLCGMSIVYIIEIRVVLTIKKTCKITLVTAGMKTVSSSGEDISTEHVISVLIVSLFLSFKHKVILYLNTWKACCYWKLALSLSVGDKMTVPAGKLPLRLHNNMNVHVPTNICFNSTSSYTCTIHVLQKAIGGNCQLLFKMKPIWIYFIYMSINDSNL